MWRLLSSCTQHLQATRRGSAGLQKLLAGLEAGLRGLYCDAQQGSWANGCLTLTFILGMCRTRRIHRVNKTKFSSFRQSNTANQAVLMHTARAKLWNSLTQEINGDNNLINFDDTRR